jgi:hypothetical protein
LLISGRFHFKGFFDICFVGKCEEEWHGIAQSVHLFEGKTTGASSTESDATGGFIVGSFLRDNRVLNNSGTIMEHNWDSLALTSGSKGREYLLAFGEIAQRTLKPMKYFPTTCPYIDHKS